MCKGVGGTTLHWAGFCVRFKDYEFKTRTTYGEVAGANLADWPIGLADLAPYYDKAEHKMGVTGTNDIPFHPPSNNHKVFAAGARRIGYRHLNTGNLAINPVPRDGRNACDQIGFCYQGCRSGAKWATFNSELPKAEATGHCEVRPRCMALRIEHDQRGRVTGVVYADGDGDHRVQKARAVCVAGNAIETPRLLLNSETSAFPDGLANASGMVGKNYMRHVFGYVYAAFEHPVNMYRGIPVGGVIHDEARHDPARGFAGGLHIGQSALGLPFYAAFLNPGAWGRDHTDWIEVYDHVASGFVIGEDMALESNAVSLHRTEKDQYGLPIPSLNLDDHPNEIAIKNYGMKRVRAIYEAMGARRIYDAPVAAVLAQPRHLPHERAGARRRGRPVGPEP